MEPQEEEEPEVSDPDGLEPVDLTQMTIISTTVGRNSLEEME